MTWQSKKLMYVYLIETKAAHSSAFPAHFYNTGIVHHFHTVNHLYTVETRHICGLQARVPVHQSPCSQPGLRKAGWGPGNEATIHFILVDGWA